MLFKKEKIIVTQEDAQRLIQMKREAERKKRKTKQNRVKKEA